MEIDIDDLARQIVDRYIEEITKSPGKPIIGVEVLGTGNGGNITYQFVRFEGEPGTLYIDAPSSGVSIYNATPEEIDTLTRGVVTELARRIGEYSNKITEIVVSAYDPAPTFSEKMEEAGLTQVETDGNSGMSYRMSLS